MVLQAREDIGQPMPLAVLPLGESPVFWLRSQLPKASTSEVSVWLTAAALPPLRQTADFFPGPSELPVRVMPN